VARRIDQVAGIPKKERSRDLSFTTGLEPSSGIDRHLVEHRPRRHDQHPDDFFPRDSRARELPHDPLRQHVDRLVASSHLRRPRRRDPVFDAEVEVGRARF
jgi:hypothetical protein